ncbi:uncharacterized protein [Hemitrygon akajei]|uniref:uncharacterized protein isoform X2 n=1 Tax=Hemitrygon akajei TaxID=2704970 RepID=UPI003BFA2953
MAKIGQQWLNLPQDILLEVFRYLTFEEKANVRATCKYLQQLIDHPTLWLNKTIVLKSLQNCNSCFWTTLRKRRIKSLLIREATPKQLQKMVNLIPNLAAVSMDVKVNVERLRALRPLANLHTLQLNNSSLKLDQELLREVVNFKQLTTLGLCSLVSGHSSSLCLLAELKKLQSLTLHARQKSPSLSAIQYILFRLPKLRELSLSSVDTWENLSLCFTAPEKKTPEEAGNGPFGEFVSILPSNLIRIDLVNARLSDADVQLLSDSSGKSLKHLGLMLCSGITETMLKQLPKQFPYLQTLDLSGYRLLNQGILFGLVEMSFLKEIVISNNPHLNDIITKQFRALTDNRVHLTQKSRRNRKGCDCIFYSQFLG